MVWLKQFSLLRIPESLRASLLQVVHMGWDSFNTASKNVEEIRLLSAQVSPYVKDIIEVSKPIFLILKWFQQNLSLSFPPLFPFIYRFRSLSLSLSLSLPLLFLLQLNIKIKCLFIYTYIYIYIYILSGRKHFFLITRRKIKGSICNENSICAIRSDWYERQKPFRFFAAFTNNLYQVIPFRVVKHNNLNSFSKNQSVLKLSGKGPPFS